MQLRPKQKSPSPEPVAPELSESRPSIDIFKAIFSDSSSSDEDDENNDDDADDDDGDGKKNKNDGSNKEVIESRGVGLPAEAPILPKPYDPTQELASTSDKQNYSDDHVHASSHPPQTVNRNVGSDNTQSNDRTTQSQDPREVQPEPLKLSLVKTYSNLTASSKTNSSENQNHTASAQPMTTMPWSSTFTTAPTPDSVTEWVEIKKKSKKSTKQSKPSKHEDRKKGKKSKKDKKKKKKNHNKSKNSSKVHMHSFTPTFTHTHIKHKHSWIVDDADGVYFLLFLSILCKGVSDCVCILTCKFWGVFFC